MIKIPQKKYKKETSTTENILKMNWKMLRRSFKRKHSISVISKEASHEDLIRDSLVSSKRKVMIQDKLLIKR